MQSIVFSKYNVNPIKYRLVVYTDGQPAHEILVLLNKSCFNSVSPSVVR